MDILITVGDERVLRRFGQRALSTFATVRHSFEVAATVAREDIEGAIVECGVFAGTQVAAMAYGSSRYEHGRPTRPVHLFDSFQGIPEAGPNDDDSITSLIGAGEGRLVTTGVSACSVAQVKQHMKEWGIDESRLFYHEGWFEETGPVSGIDKIAVLRLDGDLYSSTKVCLEHLYPKVVDGGFVIIDDYALNGCKKAVHEYLNLHGLAPQIKLIPGGNPDSDENGPAYWRVVK